jgi:undecaprenyl-diphosphatase
MADLSFGNAVVLGMAQGLAFQPGVSRSGVTLSVARSLRVERTEAARLVFLMSLPVIAGAGLLSAVDVTVPAGWWPPFLAGMAAAAVSGWFAVHGLLRLLARTGLGGFAAYRVAVGLGVLALLATGVR